jgi:benzoate-CoA ligase
MPRHFNGIGYNRAAGFRHAATRKNLVFPKRYNATSDLIGRNLESRRDKTALIDDQGPMTYAALAERVDRFANMLKASGIEPGERVLLALYDGRDFFAAFLGAMKAGAVAVPVNTWLSSDEYDFLVADSEARLLALSAGVLAQFQPILEKNPRLGAVIAGGQTAKFAALDDRLSPAPASFEAWPTGPDDPAFWLYSSGSTGKPKAVVHLHRQLVETAELYARGCLGLGIDDIVFSAARLFFAYGLGNSLTFPLALGATAVLMAEKPTPEIVIAKLKAHRPTVFFGVPTLFASLLAHPDLPARQETRLRFCVSAGEALPEDIGRRWRERLGVDIVDGLGSTEMLHIFLSNRPDEVRYGTSGRPVPGYEIRIVGEDGGPVEPGEIGELWVKGPTSAPLYWNNPEKSRETFVQGWTRSGDKYRQDETGCYVYCGRTDDMMKVAGQWVSPFEVEAALLSQPSVLEAAVIGRTDAGLVRPMAFVVPKPGVGPTPELEAELFAHCKKLLPAHKRPRWIEFRASLPKTATGKIQRFRLREENKNKGAT